MEPLARINDKQHKSSLVYGQLCLPHKTLLDIITFVRLKSAGITKNIVATWAFHSAKDAIPRNARGIINNAPALPNQSIKDATLAHIWSSNYRNEAAFGISRPCDRWLGPRMTLQSH
jgi:hypothetical protein